MCLALAPLTMLMARTPAVCSLGNCFGGRQQLSAEGPEVSLHQWSDGLITKRELELCPLPGQKRALFWLGCNQALSSNQIAHWAFQFIWAGIYLHPSANWLDVGPRGKDLNYPLRIAELASRRQSNSFGFYFTDQFTTFCSNGEDWLESWEGYLGIGRYLSKYCASHSKFLFAEEQTGTIRVSQGHPAKPWTVWLSFCPVFPVFLCIQINDIYTPNRSQSQCWMMLWAI